MKLFINFVTVYLAYVFLVAIVVFMATGLIFRRYRKMFYSCLLFIGFYIYLYVVQDTVFTTSLIFGGPTHEVLVPYSKFWAFMRVTLVFMVIYGTVGIVTSLVRSYMKLPSSKLFIYSLLGFSMGLIGLLIFYLLPCELSPDGCRISPPLPPIAPR